MDSPKETYLRVKDRGEGLFHTERILEFRTSNRTIISAPFDGNNIREGLGLRVQVLSEEGYQTSVALPQADGDLDMRNICQVMSYDIFNR